MTRGCEVKEIPIVTRLERVRMHPYLENCNVLERPAPVNPDGPEAAAIIRELARQVEVAAVIFEEYGRLHRKKGTREGDLKAERNEQYAAEMRAALTRVQVESSDE